MPVVPSMNVPNAHIAAEDDLARIGRIGDEVDVTKREAAAVDIDPSTAGVDLRGPVLRTKQFPRS